MKIEEIKTQKEDPRAGLENILMSLKDPFIELMKLDVRLLRIERKEVKASDVVENLKIRFTEINKKIESVDKSTNQEIIDQIELELNEIKKLINESSGKINLEIDSWKDRYGM